MADNGCIGCGQAITQQKANDEKTIQVAKQKAKDENRTIGLFRDETGRLCIATGDDPITMSVTPFM